MKQVWVKSATCACTASTTRGAALPTETTAMPEPKSISWLPSTSTTMPPPARCDVDRQRGADAGATPRPCAGVQLARARPGDRGVQHATLLDASSVVVIAAPSMTARTSPSITVSPSATDDLAHDARGLGEDRDLHLHRLQDHDRVADRRRRRRPRRRRSGSCRRVRRRRCGSWRSGYCRAPRSPVPRSAR